ncbi:MAG TPA: glycosyltransferase family 2 protein [Candidatus Goldiibacteriota bacterium]|nr:glycosyltransferase family 2 protein [Candidatus Goldiibacteriota bacterium]
MKNKSLLSFVIPCYRSELTIENVVNEIIDAVKNRTEYEIILVNDCSPDNVENVIKRICGKNKKVKLISLARNFGQHAALMAGYSAAKGDIIISLDDDGQTPADEVFKLIDGINKGADVVYARYQRQMQNVFRSFGTRVNQIMMEVLTDKPKAVDVTSYFAMKRFVLLEILKYRNPYPYIGGLICRVTRNIINVPVNHRSRQTGRSGYTINKLLALWLNGFTAFSIKPLRIASVMGGIVAAFGFIYGSFIILRKIFVPSNGLVGWSSTVAIILFIGGMLMLMLGLTGEYIGRIYISLNNSPQYVIKGGINYKNTGKKKTEE